MLTIKMLADKNLVITTHAKIYQRQSLVDDMQIFVPYLYDDIDLRDFVATIEWVDAANVAHSDTLVADEDLYKDNFIRYTLPLDSKFTYMAGIVVMKLTLTHYDESEEKRYVLRTGELEIEILKLNDYFVYTDDSSLDVITNKIMELQTETDKLAAVSKIYAENLPDDLAMSDSALLQLSVNGSPIGEGVQLAAPVDEDDGKDDGVIDLDIDSDDDDITEVAVIEL